MPCRRTPSAQPKPEVYGDKGLVVQLEDFVRDETHHPEETQCILQDWPLFRHTAREADRITGERTVQCDEMWSFVYAKQKNVPTAKAAPTVAGNIWTWVGIDAETRFVIS